MKLLLTGSSGFIGSYFVENYKNKYNVKTFSFRNDNLDTLECSGLDVVLYLSALVHQMDGASAEEYERVNVTQTLELAKKAKESGVKHFVFMSTVKVYGEETDSVYTEESECHPEDAYGKSKLKTERELFKLEDDGFRVSIIRTPIVYGYGVKANIKSLVSLVSKVPVLPFGGIKNRRSMVYVGNLCWLVDEVVRFRVNPGMTEGAGMTEGSAVTRECHLELDSRSKNIFLASDNESISTTRLCELIAKSMGKKVYLVKVPFFESFLKLVKPSFHKRLYGNLEIDNTLTMQRLFEIPNRVGNDVVKMPFSVEEGIELMIKGENI